MLATVGELGEILSYQKEKFIFMGQKQLCLDSVLNVTALVGTFNQVKVLVGAFSIVKTMRSVDLRCSFRSQLYSQETAYYSALSAGKSINIRNMILVQQ